MAKKSLVKRASKKKPLVLPSFLPGMRGSAAWHVRGAKPGETPHTLNQMGGSAEFVIPLDGSEESELVKLHELLHAAHSPVEQPRDIVTVEGKIIHRDALLIAEEFRINLLCRMMVGYENLPDQQEREAHTVPVLVQTFLTSKSPVDLIELVKWTIVGWPLDTAAFSHSAPATRTVYALASQLEDNAAKRDIHDIGSTLDQITFTMQETVWYKEILNCLEHGEIPTWKSVIKLAEWIEQIWDELSDLIQNPEGTPSEEEVDQDLKGLAHRAQGTDFEDVPGGATTEQPLKNLSARLHRMEANNKKKGSKPPDQNDLDNEPRWGTMSMRVAKLTQKLPKKLISRSKWGASDEGAVPRYVHRLPIDGKIFGRKKKTVGGTVLIDDSGSMSWSQVQIQRIMEAAPAANIAAYSGEMKSGELVILAQDGKYADVRNDPSARPHGGNNLVDYPALQWLAKMPKPRIWVTDTGITLVDGSLEKAYRQVLDICKAKDINVVPNGAAAAEVFEGKREIHR